MMSESPEGHAPKKKRLSRANLILLGLVTGIAAGLFFGEYCAPLEYVGNAFVNLLQMTVLPYIVVAIIYRVGSLSRSELRQLATAAGSIMLVIWLAGGVLIAVLPFALPDWEAASYFSRALTEEPEASSIFDQIFTSNPFQAMSEGFIPAIVLFCICCGLSLSSMSGKEHVLRMLAAWEEMLVRVNSAVLYLMPLGVFAIAAKAAGTMDLSEASRIQGYVALQVVAAVLLVLGLFPLFISILTPLKYRDIVNGSREVVITALATGKVVAVLPLIIETSQRLLRKSAQISDETLGASEAVVPLAYSFPHLGRLLSLLFVPFAAWFVGTPMRVSEAPELIGTGFLSLFGSPLLAIPYLLDAQQLPTDMFQLFLASGVVCGPLADGVGAMHLMTLALVTPCLLQDGFRFSVVRLVLVAGSGALMIAAATIGTRSVLAYSLLDQLEPPVTNMAKSSPLEFRTAEVSRVTPSRPWDATQWESHVDRIVETETIRVGYHPDNIPFSFFNNNDELVGLDVDMAKLLAEDLGVSITFVPFQFETLSVQLRRGDFDLGMSGIVMTPTRLLRMSLTEGYIDSTIAFLVKDHRRDEFSSAASLARLKSVSVAVVNSSYFERRVQSYLPQARIVHLDSVREFFTDSPADALIISAEAGSAWTIDYPNYTVAIPRPDTIRYPLVYAAADGDTRMSDLVSRWLEMRRRTPVWQSIYDYWILGVDDRPQQPRWSVVRDVLQWVD
jgi:Na+/H+-dicarboxylate symporter